MTEINAPRFTGYYSLIATHSDFIQGISAIVTVELFIHQIRMLFESMELIAEYHLVVAQ